MKFIKSMLLLQTILFAASANSTLITSSQHTLNIGPPATISSSAETLFSVFPFVFDPNQIEFNFFSNATVTTVEVTEVSNGDGTVTRTESEFNVRLERNLLELVFDSALDLAGFNADTDFFTSPVGSFVVDLSNATVTATSAILFNARVDTTEVSRDFIGSESTIIRASTPPVVSDVSAPSAFALLALGLIGLVSRKRFNLGRSTNK